MKKVFIFCGGLLLLFGFTIPILWEIRRAHYEPKVREAKHFCEVLIPKIESARQRDGKYPQTIDQKMFEGKPVPELIRISDFYDSHGEVYHFHFRYPGDFWDNVWGYQCGPEQRCAWESYDEN